MSDVKPKSMPILKGKIGITVTKGNAEEYVSITVIDENSRAEFLKVKMSYEEFGKALCNQYSECEFELRGTNKVGKKHEHKEFIFEFPDVGYGIDRKNKAREMVKQLCPAGWEPDAHFSSQSSFFNKDGKDFARDIIRRWV